VRQYSLGMRQRLGIAHALLGDPAVLILDEPANGLDPEGMNWLRGLLRYFADQGTTVLLSSHLLDEMQKIVDEVLLIHRGRLLRTGTLEDFVSEQACVVRSAAGSEEAVTAALTSRTWQTEPLGDGRLRVQAPADEVSPAIGAGPGAGAAIVEACSLESEFLRLTRSDGGDTAVGAGREGAAL
jgi:ABC-2 type transport system ATP-binding protein